MILSTNGSAATPGGKLLSSRMVSKVMQVICSRIKKIGHNSPLNSTGNGLQDRLPMLCLSTGMNIILKLIMMIMEFTTTASQ